MAGSTQFRLESCVSNCVTSTDGIRIADPPPIGKISCCRASRRSAFRTRPTWSQAVYHLYVIRTKDRDALAAHLITRGISTGVHYPVPVHLQNCYVGWGYGRGSLPVTERVAAEILSLPMFPGLTEEQQRRVCSEIQAFGQERCCH